MVSMACDATSRADSPRLGARKTEVDSLSYGSQGVGALRELVRECLGCLFDESTMLLCQSGKRLCL